MKHYEIEILMEGSWYLAGTGNLPNRAEAVECATYVAVNHSTTARVKCNGRVTFITTGREPAKKSDRSSDYR